MFENIIMYIGVVGGWTFLIFMAIMGISMLYHRIKYGSLE